MVPDGKDLSVPPHRVEPALCYAGESTDARGRRRCPRPAPGSHGNFGKAIRIYGIAIFRPPGTRLLVATTMRGAVAPTCLRHEYRLKLGRNFE
jgi:hypothetical protein